MRKMLFFGLAALMTGLLSTACVDQIAQQTVVLDEKQETPVASENTIVFKATLEQGDGQTKTMLNSGLAVVWTEGDAIRVYNSSHLDGEVFTLTAGAGSVEGEFTGSLSGGGPYYAVYPADAASAMTVNPMTFHIAVPEAQKFANGSFGKDANISWAMAGTESDLYFHNVFGAVSFTLTGTASIREVHLYPRGNDVLNGELAITNLGGDGDPWVSLDGGAGNQSLSINCGTGVSLNTAEGIKFCFSVPAGAFADGFFVEFVDADGGVMIKSAKGGSANVIERGVVRKMPAFSYAPQYKAAFLDETDDFAAYSGVNAAGTPVKQCIYTEGVSQYAFLTTDGDPGSRYVRFQDWNTGYSLALQIDSKELALNAKPNVTVKAQGETGTIVSHSDAMKVVKKTAGHAWLYDEDTHNGYVIKLED